MQLNLLSRFFAQKRDPAHVEWQVELEDLLVKLRQADRIRRGELRSGFEVLLDVIRLGDDLSRGPTTAVTAMIGRSAARQAHGQLETLLVQDLPWDEETLRELRSGRFLREEPRDA